MTETILQAFWLFLPAALANMTPVFLRELKLLHFPIHKELLGHHKTVKGFIFGVIVAIIAVYIQKFISYPYAIIDYSSANLLLLGFLLGAGALGGDAVESFVKRRLRIKPGKSFAPWDQLDWIIGAVILTSFYINIELKLAITAVVLFALLHPITNLIGYHLGIKKSKF